MHPPPPRAGFVLTPLSLKFYLMKRLLLVFTLFILLAMPAMAQRSRLDRPIVAQRERGVFTWQKIPDAAHYLVRWKAWGSTLWLQFKLDGDVTRYSFSSNRKTLGLSFDENYTFKIRAIPNTDSKKRSKWSAEETFWILRPDQPHARRLATPTVQLFVDASFTWQKIPDAAHYLVRWRKWGDTTWQTFKLSGDVTRYSFSSDRKKLHLDYEQDFTFKIRAMNDTGSKKHSKWSASYNLRVPHPDRLAASKELTGA